MKTMLDRRQFLRALAASGALAALPSMPRVQAAGGEKKFLFLFAGGGWDTTFVFESKFGSTRTDMDPMAYAAKAGNINYVASERWPAVSRYFSKWGARSAIINGIDTHSVGHESCTQFMMTGTSASSIADWPTTLAANATLEYSLPHVVYSGPSFPGNSGATVVRGGGGTLLDLIDGDIVGQSDKPAPKMTIPADQMVDAFVYKRIQKLAPQRFGMGRAQADALLSAHDKSSELEGRSFEAGLSRQGGGLLERSLAALDVMRMGLSRCAMVGVGFGWDNHMNVAVQGQQFDAVFDDLDQILTYMATTPGQTSPYLINEVVVVLMSEMGRTPKINGSMGKDHWPYTSVLVAGAGIKGNQVIGSTDDGLVSKPIDLKTGQASSSGSILAAEHLGAAFLKLGGLDPQKFLSGVQVLDALIA
ncbi:MAG: DUF1501 domain-containing protein [Myxococcota bacterium]